MRGSVVLPAGTGKKVRVAVFAQGDKAKAAEEAGADIVGFDDLAAKIKEGFMDFDVVIASPDAMRVVGQLGQILGPRGLMPNPKVGTVSADVVQAVKNAKAGQVQYRTDKAGIVQCTIGRASFTPEQLKTNLTALIDALNKAKPQGVKGIYLRKVSVSSTMGAGVRIDTAAWRSRRRTHDEFEGVPGSPARSSRADFEGTRRVVTARCGPSKTAGAKAQTKGVAGPTDPFSPSIPHPAQMVPSDRTFLNDAVTGRTRRGAVRPGRGNGECRAHATSTAFVKQG